MIPASGDKSRSFNAFGMREVSSSILEDALFWQHLLLVLEAHQSFMSPASCVITVGDGDDHDSVYHDSWRMTAWVRSERVNIPNYKNHIELIVYDHSLGLLFSHHRPSLRFVTA